MRNADGAEQEEQFICCVVFVEAFSHSGEKRSITKDTKKSVVKIPVFGDKKLKNLERLPKTFDEVDLYRLGFCLRQRQAKLDAYIRGTLCHG